MLLANSQLRLGVLFALVLACSPARAATQAQAPVAPERIARLLARLSDEDPSSPESVATQLAQLGSEALPSMLGTLVEGRWSRPRAEGEPELAPLSEPERTVLEEAVRRLGRAPVETLARGALVEDCPVALRSAALVGLALVGRGKDLALALEIARTEGAESAYTPRLLDALAESVAAIGRRDAAAVREVPLLVRSCTQPEAGALIRGCAASGRAEAFFELGSLARTNGSWIPCLLPELVVAARAVPRPVDPALLADVRRHLDTQDVVVARAAALALAGLGDFDSAPALIEMLDSESKLLRDAAATGLRSLTGLALGTQSRDWERWLEAEQGWFEREAPQLLEQLKQAGLGQRTAALAALAGHRYRRDELAASVEAALEDAAPEVRRMACVALTGLRCAASAHALTERLEDPDPTVARAAWIALKLVTGRKLAPNRALWVAALEG